MFQRFLNSCVVKLWRHIQSLQRRKNVFKRFISLLTEMECNETNTPNLVLQCIRELDLRKLQKTLESEPIVDLFIGKDGSTALHLASSLSDEADCLTVAEVLLAHGANPNIPNKKGKTSVHIAASMGYNRLLDLLLVNGGDPLLGDKIGQSSVDYAHHHHQLEVVKQLNKLLDTENYGGAQEDSQRIIFSFLRREVVELMGFCASVDEESDDLYYSCDSDVHSKEGIECLPSSPNKVNQRVKNDRNNVSQGESLSREFVNFKQTKESKITEAARVPHCQQSCVKDIPSWIRNNDFLRQLKQEVEKCQTDSDSDHDLRSLRTYMGKRLKHGNVSFHEPLDSLEEGMESQSDSLDEFDIAQLTIDISFSTGSEDETNCFNGTYIPRSAKNLFSSDRYISDSLQDSDEETLISGNEFDCTPTYVMVQPTHNTFKHPEKNSHTISSQSSSSTREVEHKFDGGEFADVTAPENSIKPDASTTLNLLKAPRKRRPYISKNKERVFKCKNKFPRYHEMLHAAPVSSMDKNDKVFKPADGRLTVGHQVFPAQVTPQSSLKSSATKTTCSSHSSCQSLISIVEEFLYEDSEAGVKLIERRCPTTATVSSIISGGSKASTLTTHTVPQAPDSKYPFNDESQDSVGPLTESVKAMDAEDLCARFRNLGYVPGPITPFTQRIYQRHLLRLRKNPHLLQQSDHTLTPKYPRELRAALKNPPSGNCESWASLERVMSAPFCQPDPTRHWRNGTNKTCFNYLLLDPRITQDLPLRGSVMDEVERLRCFIAAIFYIGKGSRGRPYSHLYEAMKKQDDGKQQSEKIDRIRDIWAEGVGVVSLHVFQNTIAVEAWTREAAMISAIGLENLCNTIQGTFYGLPSTWRLAERRQLGTHLLRRTLNIFMQEGERQLRPTDLPLPTWMK
ncbi:ankyrin repeat and LEM domain-containing protein 1-like [Homarus americanus]|uniref:ankyrin repeat and LEM domain-containing protein 1-like n=1 Tax=Homarus americanus TaxID=6706 RepID=UPI001C447566|nr:ankyrin repeat and LEM domain-containing protein 1-like [Homarus americanus]